MAFGRPEVPARVVAMPKIDPSVPHSARFWNYLVGGKDNFESDREAARRILAVLPVLADTARSERKFLGRVVRFLALEGGIRQFLDIGTGIPTANNTHEVAQSIAPECRIVYVDNDPIVLAHARSLLTSTAEGATSYVDADVQDPGLILREAAQTLDFSQPVGIMLLGILNFVVDFDSSREILSQLVAAVPAGSYVVIEHPASDLDPAMLAGARRWNEMTDAKIILRTRDEVASYFAGLRLIEPGLVELQDWRPDDEAPPGAVPLYAGVARKP
jgi:hypothetical protein